MPIIIFADSIRLHAAKPSKWWSNCRNKLGWHNSRAFSDLGHCLFHPIPDFISRDQFSEKTLPVLYVELETSSRVRSLRHCRKFWIHLENDPIFLFSALLHLLHRFSWSGFKQVRRQNGLVGRKGEDQLRTMKILHCQKTEHFECEIRADSRIGQSEASMEIMGRTSLHDFLWPSNEANAARRLFAIAQWKRAYKRRSFRGDFIL